MCITVLLRSIIKYQMHRIVCPCPSHLYLQQSIRTGCMFLPRKQNKRQLTYWMGLFLPRPRVQRAEQVRWGGTKFLGPIWESETAHVNHPDSRDINCAWSRVSGHHTREHTRCTGESRPATLGFTHRCCYPECYQKLPLATFLPTLAFVLWKINK